MKKILSILLVSLVLVSPLISHADYKGIDAEFYHWDISMREFKDVYISHTTLKQKIAGRKASQVLTTILGVGGGFSLGKLFGGIVGTVFSGVISVMHALEGMFDANISLIDEGYGIWYTLEFLDVDAGWFPVGEVHPQPDYDPSVDYGHGFGNV